MTQANGKEKAIFGRVRTIIVPDVGILSDWGVTVPADGTEGYAPGCIFQDVDASADAAFLVNQGTKASCNFDAIDIGAITAADVDIVDAGTFYAAETVEAALAELGGTDFTNRFTVSKSLDSTAAATAANFGKIFVAPRACTVTKITEVHTVAGSDGGAVTLHVERLQGTETSGNGDDLHTTGMNLKSTAETPQSPTLLATGVATLAVGDRLNLNDTGTLTALDGLVITIELEWVVA